jgi:hypothetical protein
MVAEVFCDGEEIFIIVDGLSIAKRGHLGTPPARTWIRLEPGYRFETEACLEIERESARVQ